MLDFARVPAQCRPVRWDIQVDASIKENFIAYNHAAGVVIRANSIELALIYVSRGRELIDKYPDNTTSFLKEDGP